MAMTKTPKPTTTTRPAATKRATPTDGSKPTAAKKTATAKPANTKATKATRPMTADEALMIAWQRDYDTRHAREKRAASTNGSKPRAAKKATTAKPASTKATRPMTTNEAVLRAWQHDYDTRHARVKRTA